MLPAECVGLCTIWCRNKLSCRVDSFSRIGQFGDIVGFTQFAFGRLKSPQITMSGVPPISLILLVRLDYPMLLGVLRLQTYDLLMDCPAVCTQSISEGFPCESKLQGLLQHHSRTLVSVLKWLLCLCAGKGLHLHCIVPLYAFCLFCLP